MSTPNLEELAAIEGRMTPGDWHYTAKAKAAGFTCRRCGHNEERASIAAGTEDSRVSLSVATMTWADRERLDGPGIVALRNAAPFLLTTLKRYEAALQLIAGGAGSADQIAKSALENK